MTRPLLFLASLLALGLVASAMPACGSDNSGDNNGGDGGAGDDGGGTCTGFCPNADGGKPGCVGLGCSQVDCGDPTVKTTLTGTVFDPAGRVPIFNAIVYVPQNPDAQLGNVPEGASCDRCDAKITDNPVAITSTDTSGNFVLKDVPVANNLPLIIQIGKWRRLVHVPTVTKCATATVDAALTRLPKNRSEGHIPRMALTTGAADALQCLLRKIGLDDAEFGVAGADARVHLYQGGGYNSGGVKLASSKFASGTPFPPADGLWSSAANLAKYDVVLLACEGGENDVTTAVGCPTCQGATKTPDAKTALYGYAKAGGRVFMSHYHEVWIRTNPDAAVAGVATFAVDTFPPGGVSAKTTAVNTDISTAFPKAVAMADWLGKQNALVSGKLPIFDARDDVDAVGPNALGWISVFNAAAPPGGNPVNKTAVEYMSFNTPVGAADANVCGRVVLSDIHVAAGAAADDPAADFPAGCNTEPLNAQQKALEFMLFDLSSCVQNDQGSIIPPH